jgi:DNA repair exonuclease SbcCD nuclease subunit
MFNKTVPLDEEDAGLNQREADIYNAWDKLVQEAIQIKPDVFIHAGDFFDRVSPSNRAIVRARDGLYKLSEAGIKSVILAGNHETPRLAETGHVFNLLERIPNVTVMYNGKSETIAVEDLLITGVAHSSTLAEQVSKATPDPDYKYNILVTHGSVTGANIDVFESNELNQTTLPIELFKKPWDYIALGHYHNFTKLQDNMCYCSSPERLSISEADYPKGYVLAELPNLKFKHKKIEAREFVKLEYDAGTHGHDSLTDKLMEEIKLSKPDGKIVRLIIKNLKKELWATVDRKALQNAAKKTVNLAIKPDLISGHMVTVSNSEIGPLEEEFQKYLEEVPIDDIDEKEKQFILDKAREVLS